VIALAYVYLEDESGRRSAAKMLSGDEAHNHRERPRESRLRYYSLFSGCSRESTSSTSRSRTVLVLALCPRRPIIPGPAASDWTRC